MTCTTSFVSPSSSSFVLQLLLLLLVNLSQCKDIPSASNSTSSGNCQKLSSADLARRLQDAGGYNEKYMAATLDDAARRFPDLTSRHFVHAAEKYACDAECQARTTELKNAFDHRTEADWPRLNVPNAWDNIISRPGVTQIPPATFTVSSAPVSARNQSRQKRASGGKTTFDLESVGQSYIIYCSGAGYEEEAGYHKLCGGCRSIRELPDTYFPRFLNEVRCADTQCVREHGQCVQKYLSLDILRNEGSKDCHDWVSYTVNVPVCCDCLLSSQSAIFLSLVQKD